MKNAKSLRKINPEYSIVNNFLSTHDFGPLKGRQGEKGFT